MRESTSPPREPNGIQQQEAEKISVSQPKSPSSSSSGRSKQLNNNDIMQDSNISTIQSDVTTKKNGDIPVPQNCTNPIQNGKESE